MKTKLPTFLPGRFVLAPGHMSDYDPLERFHYIPKRPATWSAVWVVRYRDRAGEKSRVVAIGVLSYPYVCCAAREKIFKLSGPTYRRKVRFANRHIRTISRIIVHPQFRSIGLATLLVDCLCKHCPTRYVEAMAVMGRVHPFFEKAGMKRYEPAGEGPVYFLMDRRRLSPSPFGRGTG